MFLFSRMAVYCLQNFFLTDFIGQWSVRHYREDYPQRDDAYLGWLTIEQDAAQQMHFAWKPLTDFIGQWSVPFDSFIIP